MQQVPIDSGQNPEFSIEKGKTTKVILEFLDEKLPGFINDFSGNVDSEDLISQECCIYLQRHAREFLFMFHFQYKYVGSRRSSDLSVISAKHHDSKIPILVIEAKRLPTPGKEREREYVEGNLGGIERFKRSSHGSELVSSVMLAYVQAQEPDYWLKEINSWITDLAINNKDTTIQWQISEHLILVKKLKDVTTYSSTHLKTNSSKIILKHYWIPLQQSISP